jgi:signal transduction histidine kinase
MTACANNASNPSISTVLNSWLKLRAEVLNTKLPEAAQEAAQKAQHEAPDSGLDGKIEDFRLALDLFAASPIGSIYKIHHPEHLQYLADIDAAVQRLNKALKEGGSTEILSIILEIDTNLDQMRLIEKSLSDNSQLNHFMLFFFFSMFIIIFVLAFWGLHARLEKTEIRQRQSAAFSRETIIAQEQERMRISLELHDTIAQDLRGLSMGMEKIGLCPDLKERIKLCTEAASVQSTLIRKVRDVCEYLIPPDFNICSLQDALRRLCFEFGKRANLDCRISITENTAVSSIASLNKEKQLLIFRIVQEALTNIEKHAEAKEAIVILRDEENGTIAAGISDDGKGFNPDGSDGHMGIRGMKERAALLGGVLKINSEQEGGTLVRLEIPANGVKN